MPGNNGPGGCRSPEWVRASAIIAMRNVNRIIRPPSCSSLRADELENRAVLVEEFWACGSCGRSHTCRPAVRGPFLLHVIETDHLTLPVLIEDSPTFAVALITLTTAVEIDGSSVGYFDIPPMKPEVLDSALASTGSIMGGHLRRSFPSLRRIRTIATRVEGTLEDSHISTADPSWYRNIRA
jgi:hypothetical protein